MYSIVVNIVLLLLLGFLAFMFFKKKQDVRLNWAVFYSTLYVSLVLPFVNQACVYLGFWEFKNTINEIIKLPIDVYFIWIMSWSVIPVFLFKGNYLILISLIFFFLDLVLMPILEQQGLFKLNSNWLIGELITLLFVFIPSYYWSYLSLNDKKTSVRAFFQVTLMALTFLFILPILLKNYHWIEFINYKWTGIQIQIFLIIIFPSLVAVNDLVTKGKGTAFPYDPTKKIVRKGIYSYCTNPIQWSFTMVFVLLSIYNSSVVFLLGSFFSIAYVYGVSNYQEYSDMELRFGDKWNTYKKNVPKWLFQWKPIGIPESTIYFDSECKQCNQFSKWFVKRKPINLKILPVSESETKDITQVTYIDEYGEAHASVNAVANAFNHINLAYASLGWLMQMPIVNFILQAIVDALGLFREGNICDLE